MKTKILLIALIGLLFTINLASAAISDNYSCPMGGMMYGAFGGYGTGMMFFSWIIYVLVIILIIAAIYWLVKSANHKR
ncbi:MAG: hypothetical protein AABX17_03990 [Nanoarchaeota archaeon]